MVIKRDMTAAESNYLQCSILIMLAGIVLVLISDLDVVGYGSIALGIAFFVGFLFLKKKTDEAEIAKATKTVRKDQPKDGFKVRYTSRKERKAAKQAEEEKNKKAFPANKSGSVKKKNVRTEDKDANA